MAGQWSNEQYYPYAEDWAREAYMIGPGRVPTRVERRLRIDFPWSRAHNEIFGSEEAVKAKERSIKNAYIGVLNRDPKNPMSAAELADRMANLWVTYTYQQFIAELVQSEERRLLLEELAKKTVVEPTPAPPDPPPSEDPSKIPTEPTGPATDPPPSEAEVRGILDKLLKWILRK